MTNKLMHIDIVTIFPEMFLSPFQFSIVKRAIDKGCIDIRIIDLRDYALDRHRSVDDYPYGGGAGMVLKPEPLHRCISDLLGQYTMAPSIYLTSPRGSKCEQRHLDELAKSESDIILLCGHYEGVDQRIIEHFNVQEISLGDYVLSGGELAAMVIVDGIARLLPGVLGNAESIEDESFRNGLLEYPHYTRPATCFGMDVPPVLLSGNHSEIKKWRHEQSVIYTKMFRPDLLE